MLEWFVLTLVVLLALVMVAITSMEHMKVAKQENSQRSLFAHMIPYYVLCAESLGIVALLGVIVIYY